jgi:transglutaminase-like putative cysteine protease
MRLRAGCELVLESERETPVVMMLRARARTGQRVIDQRLRMSRAVRVSEFRDVYGNVCERFVAPRGELTLRSELLAEVADDPPMRGDAPRTGVAKLPDETLHFTLASRYCPSDKLAQLARKVTRGCQPGAAEVLAIRDYVHDNLAYRYGVSDASTDALDTLEAGAGVCRDFAHVAIALCRSVDIPARMAVGYLHRREPMDLHAWFEAYVDGCWHPFDATEPEQRGGRIVVAHGRDAADVAFLTDYGSLKLNSMKVWVRESAVDLALAAPRLRATG